MSTAPPFVHLHTHSCYSFLNGASQPEALAQRAAELGMSHLALTDRDSASGAVKFMQACKGYGIIPLYGAEITMADGSLLTLLAETRAGYGNICALISRAYEEGDRRAPALEWESLEAHVEGVICLTGGRRGPIATALRKHREEDAKEIAKSLRGIYGTRNLFIELVDDWTPDSQRVCAALAILAKELELPTVATNDVHYATPDGYLTHDLLRCIGACTTMTAPHPERPLNREQYLKSTREMAILFAQYPEALRNTHAIAERCVDALPVGVKITPNYEEGDAGEHLRALAYAGARDRYGQVTEDICKRLKQELTVIQELGFSDYMILCRDIVHWARDQKIRVTGRGSAADSCVAYCLRLTDVDVILRRLPFERFLTEGKVPDVDCDFPSDKRDDVFRHIQAHYGADRVGMACMFNSFRARAAIRDVGKALALPAETLEFLSDRIKHGISAHDLTGAFDSFAELKDHKHLLERYQLLFQLCNRIAGYPRHIGTHSSGVLVSRVPLTHIAPLIPSAKGVLPIWTLDKDDSEEVGGIKFDVLALRILSAVSDAETDIQKSKPDFRYEDIPHDDPATFRVLQSGRQVGVFQFESSAQMALSAEMQPENFEDLVAAVALIRPANSGSGRPGENTVRQYLAARNGYKPVRRIHPALESCLRCSYGVIIFQEQVDEVVHQMMGVTRAEAEKFRKSLVRHTRNGTLAEAGEKFITGCLKHNKNFPRAWAQELWSQIKGWGGYGFLEGHAAAFSLTGLRTAFLSIHHVAEFFAGLLNHQPMGYWPSNTLVAEARRRGAAIGSLSINDSDDKCHGFPDGRLQLGLRVLTGLSKDDIARIVAERENSGPFASLLDFCVRIILRRDRLEELILSGVFDLFHKHRRGLLLRLDETLSLAAVYRAARAEDVQSGLPFGSWQTVPTPVTTEVRDFSPWEKLMWEWRTMGICASANPIGYHRAGLEKIPVITVQEAMEQPAGSIVTVAGLNLRVHRPPTHSGRKVLFSSIEDETGFIQVLCLDEVLERYTATFILSPALIVVGIVERRGVVASLLVQRAEPLRTLDSHSGELHHKVQQYR